MEKNFKFTNKKQMEKLVELMKVHPDIGRGKLPFGFNKLQLKEKWDQFTEQLNDLGPPIRNTKEWQRVWTHYKANLKRKLAANRGNFQATEISLNPLEQSTMELVSMQTRVNPSGYTVGLEGPEDSDGSESTSRSENSPLTMEYMEQPIPEKQRQPNKLDDERLEILKAQSKNQEEILKTLKRLEKNSFKNYQINRKMYELKQMKINLQMKFIKAKLELTNKRIQEM